MTFVPREGGVFGVWTFRSFIMENGYNLKRSILGNYNGNDLSYYILCYTEVLKLI